MTRPALGLYAVFTLFALAACGADNELVPVDDGLLVPPTIRDEPASSSSSGSPQAPASNSGTGGSSSSGVPTAPVVEADCNPDANYLPYVAVEGLPPEAVSLRLTGDELHAFYAVGHDDIARIFTADRAAIGDAFGPGVELGAGVNLATFVSDPLPSDDGLTLRYSVNGNSVYVAQRASVDEPFGSSVLLLTQSKGSVASRDLDMHLVSHWERADAPYERWVVRTQALGESESRIVTRAPPGHDMYTSWYEPLSHQAWITSNEKTAIFRWNGSGWSGGVALTDFRVTWSSPSGCRLYGHHEGKIQVRARIPSPPGDTPDGG